MGRDGVGGARVLRPLGDRLGHDPLSHTFVGSQFRPNQKKLQPCTAAEVKIGHFWTLIGTLATSFIAAISACCQAVLAAAAVGAERASSMYFWTVGLVYPPKSFEPGPGWVSSGTRVERPLLPNQSGIQPGGAMSQTSRLAVVG